VHSRVGAPERCGERVGAPRTDPRDSAPLGGGRLEDTCDAAELPQESLCGGRRNAAHNREHRFRRGFRAGLRALSVCGSRAGLRTTGADGESAKPVSRVVSVLRLNQPRTHLKDGDTDSPDCRSRQRPIVDRAALDKQVRLSSRGAQGAKLAPESPLLKRRVKVKNLLPLDDCAIVEEVVPSFKPTHFDPHPSPAQPLVHGGRAFEYVDGDPGLASHRKVESPVPAGSAIGRFSGAETG
jgi:hypothetical protein